MKNVTLIVLDVGSLFGPSPSSSPQPPSLLSSLSGADRSSWVSPRSRVFSFNFAWPNW